MINNGMKHLGMNQQLSIRYGKKHLQLPAISMEKQGCQSLDRHFFEGTCIAPWCFSYSYQYGLKSFQWHNLHITRTAVWIIDSNCPKPKGLSVINYCLSFCLNVELIDDADDLSILPSDHCRLWWRLGILTGDLRNPHVIATICDYNTFWNKERQTDLETIETPITLAVSFAAQWHQKTVGGAHHVEAWELKRRVSWGNSCKCTQGSKWLIS